MMTKEDMTPREIVAELDKYIIGQATAKKSVAVALRNRQRRLKLNEDMQKEITPKTKNSTNNLFFINNLLWIFVNIKTD